MLSLEFNQNHKLVHNNLFRKVVLVTGASSGLGLALAKQLIKDDKVFLILTARETSQFKFANELINETSNIWLRTLDVTNYKQILKLIGEINLKLGGVDVLINNAGVIDRSTVEDSTHEYRQFQLDVNYLAPFDIINEVLSLMRKKNKGHIINISSASGFMAMPTMSSYSASKFALEGASESLWYEMKSWGIHVTLVIPGFINSFGFMHTSESEKCIDSLQDLKSSYHEHYVGMKNFIISRMKKSTDSNEKIAKKIIQILKSDQPPLRVFVTFDAYVMSVFKKYCPQKLYMFTIYRFLPNISRWGKQPYK